jgi:hypothetical protein
MKNTLVVTKSTTKYVSVKFINRIGKEAKATVRNWGSLCTAIGLVSDADTMSLINACKTVLSADDYSIAKRHYAPTAKQVSDAKNSWNTKLTYFVVNEKKMDKEIDKMANDGGFLGNKINRSEIDSVADKQIRSLYGLG